MQQLPPVPYEQMEELEETAGIRRLRDGDATVFFGGEVMAPSVRQIVVYLIGHCVLIAAGFAGGGGLCFEYEQRTQLIACFGTGE